MSQKNFKGFVAGEEMETTRTESPSKDPRTRSAKEDSRPITPSKDALKERSGSPTKDPKTRVAKEITPTLKERTASPAKELKARVAKEGTPSKERTASPAKELRARVAKEGTPSQERTASPAKELRARVVKEGAPSKERTASPAKELRVRVAKEGTPSKERTASPAKEPRTRLAKEGTSVEAEKPQSGLVAPVAAVQDKTKPTVNGAAPMPVANGNGVSDVVLGTNGTAENGLAASAANGDCEEEDFVVCDNDNDELFPELRYDDGSDNDSFEATSPELAALSRSMTRRSQTKTMRTPETPRPKNSDLNGEDSKIIEENGESMEQSGLLQRKLRSADRNTPEVQTKAMLNGDNESAAASSGAVDEAGAKADQESSKVKLDTNFSKSRIKVSPYRKTRAHDQTSMIANYTGNNSTMETELSLTSPSDQVASSSNGQEESASDFYHSRIRTIKSRRSYKNLPEIKFTKPKNPQVVVSTSHSGKVTPVVHVVGRKRTLEGETPLNDSSISGKRMRILSCVVSPFTALYNRPRSVATSTPLPQVQVPETLAAEAANTPLESVTEPAAEAMETKESLISEKLESISDLPMSTSESIHADTKQWCILM